MSGEYNNNPQSHKTDCETLAELLPAYSMGMTDAEESLLVEELLVQCPEYHAELETYKELNSAMLFSAPQKQAPASIAANLMKLTAPDAESSVTTPPVKATVIREAPASPTPAPILRPNFRRGMLAVAGVAVAAIIILVGIVGVLLNEVNTLRQDQDALTAELQARDSFLEGLSSQDIVQYALAAQQDGSDATATVIYNPERTVAMLHVENFPPLDPTMTYQAWLANDDGRISAGVFNVNEMGQATFFFTTPQPLGVFQLMGITPEPTGGSEGPTGSPVVAGRLENESS